MPNNRLVRCHTSKMRRRGWWFLNRGRLYGVSVGFVPLTIWAGALGSSLCLSLPIRRRSLCILWSSLSLPPSVFRITTSVSVPSISSIVSVISTISTISINSTIYGIRHLASFPLPIEGAQLFVMPPLLYLPSDSDIIRSLPAYYHPLSSFPWILASNSETNASASLATSALLKTVITRTSHLPTLRATTGHQLTSDALLKYGKTSPLFPLPSGALEAYTKFEIGMSVEMGNFDPYALVLFVEHVLKPM